MDPVAHTLAGGALAGAGLGRRTPLGTATLLLAANLPDIDIVAYAWGETSALAVRRGWTHGVLALAVLPVVLAGSMLLWDRLVRRARRPELAPADRRTILLLAALGVLTHPVLDLLNVYGVRLLMPFSDRWFYGDTLFIVDPWVWAMLAGGWWLAARQRRPGPARLALVALVVYVTTMAGTGWLARRLVWRALPDGGAGVTRLMVAPRPVTPFVRSVVLEDARHYRVGALDWRAPRRFRPDELVAIGKGDQSPYVARARRVPEVRRFLGWARFPFFQVLPASAGHRVSVIDARYALEPEAAFGALTIDLP